MEKRPNVVVVLARCSRGRQEFGVRFEEQQAGQWRADWAFAIPEARARREGYDRGEIVGQFGFDPAYPGCPHCGGAALLQCSCGRVSCWDGESRTVVCPWCGSPGEIRGTVESLRAGGG